LQNAKPIIKTHDLIKLYSAVKEIKNLNIHETRLKAVDSVYVETRYPGEIGLLPNGAPTEKEAQGFLVFAREVEKIIKKELG
jgi:HEPN domain-containing protein